MIFGMNKKGVIIIIVLVAAVLVGGLVYENMTRNSVGQSADESSSDVVLYYGEECPHCKDVEKFLDDNKVADVVNFAKKEVWHNQANSNDMLAKSKTCGLREDSVGVPFLYAEGKCYVGTPDVEKYFSEKVGIPVVNPSGN
jgi:glutaredoxin